MAAESGCAGSGVRRALAPLVEMLKRVWFTAVLGSPAVILFEHQITSPPKQLDEPQALWVTH